MNSDQIPSLPAADVNVNETTCGDETNRPEGLGDLAADLIGGARMLLADGRRERKQEREKQREERKGGGGADNKPAPTPEITNVGPVGALRLPAGFRESAREAPAGGPTRIEFNNPKHE
ncbi:MAG: hypothetical protein K2Z81_27190, partial [Cyanobacteria bacterium]|nr:hypothetical protein [Cyanobacteriota bacterium]